MPRPLKSESGPFISERGQGFVCGMLVFAMVNVLFMSGSARQFLPDLARQSSVFREIIISSYNLPAANTSTSTSTTTVAGTLPGPAGTVSSAPEQVAPALQSNTPVSAAEKAQPPPQPNTQSNMAVQVPPPQTNAPLSAVEKAQPPLQSNTPQVQVTSPPLQTEASPATTSMAIQQQNAHYKTPVVNMWTHKFGDGKYNHLWFRHIRKAAGTTIDFYLDKVYDYHKLQWEQEEKESKKQKRREPFQVRKYMREFDCNDYRCPFVDPRFNLSLSVMNVRNPMERHISEFFYSGPGSGYSKLFARGEYNTTEFIHLLQVIFPKWIETGNNVTRFGRKGNRKSRGNTGRHYSDEFMIRSLAGQTTNNPLPYDEAMCREMIASGGDMRHMPNECKDPCSYGPGYSGVTFFIEEPSSEIHLERATRVMEEFDIVLVSEFLKDPDQAALLADALEVPLNVHSISKSSKNVNINKKTMSSKDIKTPYQDILKSIAPQSYKLLEEQNRFDFQLYERAIALNQALVQRWKSEKQQMQQ